MQLEDRRGGAAERLDRQVVVVGELLRHDRAVPVERPQVGAGPALPVVPERALYEELNQSGIDNMLGIPYALLGLSVIVSLFAIVNTLALAVLERTRELGTLRAVGMTRRQVRRMMRHESIIVTLIGAVLAMGVGLVLAGLVTHSLSSEGLQFSIPAGTLVAFLVVAIVAGLLAAIPPARRASRLDILTAL